MLNAKTGLFNLNVATGNQSITGLGFQPKIIFFIFCNDTSDIVTEVANVNLSIGVYGLGTANGRSAANFCDNGAETSNARSDNSAAAVLLSKRDADATTDVTASGVSLDSDGFTINQSTTPANNYQIGYLALGGDDLTNVAYSSTTTRSSAGAQSISTGFQPDCVMLMGMGTNIGVDASYGMGFAHTGVNGASMAMFDDDNDANTNGFKFFNSNRITDGYNAGSGLNFKAVLSSMDASGFTLNWTAASGARPMIYAALKGMRVKTGSFQLNTTTGVQEITGVGFQPKAGIFISSLSTADPSSQVSDYAYSIGFATSFEQRYMICGRSQTGQAISKCNHASHSEHILRNLTPFPGSIQEEVDFQQWLPDGFSVDIETALGANPSRIAYMVFGDTEDADPHDSSVFTKGGALAAFLDD